MKIWQLNIEPFKSIEKFCCLTRQGKIFQQNSACTRIESAFVVQHQLWDLLQTLVLLSVEEEK